VIYGVCSCRCARGCALCASTRAQSAGGARAVRIAKRKPATRPPPTHPRESGDLLPDIEKVPFSRHYAASATDAPQPTLARARKPRSLDRCTRVGPFSRKHRIIARFALLVLVDGIARERAKWKESGMTPRCGGVRSLAASIEGHCAV